MQVLNPPAWPRPKGYSNGIKAKGETIFLAGLVGWTLAEVFETEDLTGQARRIFESAVALLAEAGAGPEHIVRMTWFVLDKDEYLASLENLGAAYREVIGRHYPAMSVVQVAGLIEAGARLEIEITAVIPEDIGG